MIVLESILILLNVDSIKLTMITRVKKIKRYGKNDFPFTCLIFSS